jgi:subtilase family serine protease
MPSTLVCPFRKRVVISISAFLVLAIAAPAQIRNRITQNIGDTEPVMLSAPHPLARAEFDQGRVEGSMKIDHAAIVFKLSSAQQADLDKLLAEQQDPRSANYRKWLTPEQYAARFGMSDADLAKVSAWLTSQGLTVSRFSRGRTQVFFSGTAAQVESALRTQFNRYLVNGEIHFANATEISVPAALSGTVLSFRGLDDFRPRPRVHVAQPRFTSHVTGNHFVAPGDFATIYNVQPLYDAGLDGTGVKIAVVGQSLIAANNSTTDLDAFRAAAVLPKKDPTFVQVGGGTPKILSSGDQVESILDLEWSGAVAKNADIIFVFASPNGGAFDAITFAIDNNLAPVISSSYGICEAQFGSGLAAFRASVQQGNVQGQTLIGPAGDSGAADCESQTATTATHGLAVDVPAAIPEVTGVGGSEFTGDAAGAVTGTAPNTNAGPTGFWSGTTGATDTISSALSYIPEMAWNDTTAGSRFSATGGGVSTTFTKPSFQTSLTPHDGQRDVPDIALNASPNHDPTMICAQGSCVNGFRDASGSLNVVGGTSVGAPTFAAIVAILNQATQSPIGLGNINPTLYTLAASTPSAFHDITTGNNMVTCTSGTPTTGPAVARCPTTAPFVIGFSAGTGYDLVTGLGSIDANVLVTSWPGFVVTPGFSVGETPATVASPGQSGTSTITVTATNGFSGTVNLTCTPPASTASITCSFGSTTSVVLNSATTSGTATLTISTAAPHVVSGKSAALRPYGFGWLPASGGGLLAGIFVLGVPSRRRRHLAALGLMLLVFFAAGVGCGGGSSSGGSTKTGGTPAGSYNITVTATSGSTSRTAAVVVTVQ